MAFGIAHSQPTCRFVLHFTYNIFTCLLVETMRHAVTLLSVVWHLQFKRYVTKLRTKSTTYKKKKMELSGLRAELGVLARTEEVLGQRHDVLDRKLVSASFCYLHCVSFCAFTTPQCRQRCCFWAVHLPRSSFRSFVCPDRSCYHSISWMAWATWRNWQWIFIGP